MIQLGNNATREFVYYLQFPVRITINSTTLYELIYVIKKLKINNHTIKIPYHLNGFFFVVLVFGFLVYGPLMPKCI